MTKHVKVAPEIIKKPNGETIKRHPAFGIVSMNITNSTGTDLFASDLTHNVFMHFTVSLAQENRRSAADVWYDKLRDKEIDNHLLDFSMSMSQFVNLITSPNFSSGIPCTLNSYRTGDITNPPEILKKEAFHERLSDDVKAAANREIAKLQGTLDKLTALLEKGKAGKKDLPQSIAYPLAAKQCC
ncbi:hypothetical protein [Xenorhabdus hominickii]|uniref:Uncharacterized protein n=1 Tax=Xenorhabdus hominickii TaxID=351679 RepID=A0A1V0M432_XENHO|nr:hypothetical protein [Xenorhabdus hominickii]ARD69629.1 hypothetical protein [Xenorhabdus hominickii]PHM52343.1 hypothetical protein Xhom_04420 [Xenorhabdus hominickii]